MKQTKSSYMFLQLVSVFLMNDGHQQKNLHRINFVELWNLIALYFRYLLTYVFYDQNNNRRKYVVYKITWKIETRRNFLNKNALNQIKIELNLRYEILYENSKLYMDRSSFRWIMFLLNVFSIIVFQLMIKRWKKSYSENHHRS